MYSLGDTDDLGANAPQPLDASNVDEAGLQTLGHGEGAVTARRESARTSEDTPGITMSMSRRTIIALVAAATVVVLAGVSLFIWAFSAPSHAGSQAAPMRMEANTDEAVSCRDVTYSLKEQNGAYSLVETRTGETGGEVVVGNLRGVPVRIVLFDGSVVLPENLSDGTWDIAAYTVGTGCGYLSNQEGNAYGGQGTISEARLDGSTLQLVVDGQPEEVPLEW